MLFTVIVPNTRCFAVNMVARGCRGIASGPTSHARLFTISLDQ